MIECEKKLFSREDIKHLISVSALREKAIISLIALSGMPYEEFKRLTHHKFVSSASDAISKDLNDINDLFKFEKKITQEVLILKTSRVKTNMEYYFFIPPETTQLILSYLKERFNKQDMKNNCTNNDETLFINDQGNQMSAKDIFTNLQKALKNSDLEVPKNTIFRPHSLRKYFMNSIINKTGSKKCLDSLLGYKLDKDKNDIINLKEKYIQLLPSLSLNKMMTEG